MNRRLPHCFACVLACLLTAGCAVTEPTDLDTRRVHSAVADEPATPVEQLALDLGVSQLAVVRALPDDHAKRWPGSAASAWSAVQDWQAVMVRSEKVQFLGNPRFITVQSKNPSPADRSPLLIGITLDWDAVEAAWLLRRPTLDGGAELAVCWFDDDGEPVLTAKVPGGEEPAALQAARRFEQMWSDGGE